MPKPGTDGRDDEHEQVTELFVLLGEMAPVCSSARPITRWQVRLRWLQKPAPARGIQDDEARNEASK